MDRQPEALRAAIDLYLMPSRLRAMQSAPLPRDVGRILAIAADEGDQMVSAMMQTGRSESDVRLAVGFFIEHVLLSSDANSYRLLGCERTASAADLRRNMVLLMRWLHPDRQSDGVRSGNAQRVTIAWENLKSPERRAKYDMTLDQAERVRSERRGSRLHHAGRRPGRGLTRSTRRLPGLWSSFAALIGRFRK